MIQDVKPLLKNVALLSSDQLVHVYSTESRVISGVAGLLSAKGQ